MWKILIFALLAGIFLWKDSQYSPAQSFFYAAREYQNFLHSAQVENADAHVTRVVELYQKASQLEPRNYRFLKFFIAFLYDYALYPRAVELLEYALSLPLQDLQRADVYNSLAWIYLQPHEQRNPQKALDYAQVLYALLNGAWSDYSSDQIALYLDTIAEAHFVNGMLLEAKNFGFQALRLVQNNLYRKDILSHVERYARDFRLSVN